MIRSFGLQSVMVAVLLLAGVFGACAADGEKIRLRELEAVIPAGWQSEPPSSSMRLAQYQVPGADADANGAFVVYYFGSGQGGTAEANIARWTSQFSAPDGGPVEPEVETFQVDDLNVTQATLEGRYARGIGMGPQGEGVAGQILLAAVVEYGQERVIFQLYGPSETIRAQQQAFVDLLHGLSRSAQ